MAQVVLCLTVIWQHFSGALATSRSHMPLDSSCNCYVKITTFDSLCDNGTIAYQFY